MALKGKLSGRDAALVPAALACGIGLILSNTRAVLEALCRVQTPFERTAKLSARAGRARLARGLYGCKQGWIPWANLAAAGYLAFGAARLADLDSWPSLPFVLLFVAGFGYAGAAAAIETLARAGYGPSVGGDLRRQPARSSAS
jgi:hypothetical protein